MDTGFDPSTVDGAMRRNISGRPHLRWMIPRDHIEVLEIDRLSYTRPWSQDDLRNWAIMRRAVCQVAELGDQVAGFVVWETRKRLLPVRRFAVHPRWRRLGVGNAMMDWLVGKLGGGCFDRRVIEFVVSERNLGGLLFLREMGCRGQLVPGHFEDADGIRMRFSNAEAHTFET